VHEGEEENFVADSGTAGVGFEVGSAAPPHVLPTAFLAQIASALRASRAEMSPRVLYRQRGCRRHVEGCKFASKPDAS
jgi:hypothetical protein